MHYDLSPAFEDYLKAIYDLTAQQERASTLEIADRLRIKPASVTGMLQRLAAYDPPLVDYQKHRGVALTSAGRQAALEVVRHHRLLETFLQQKLGYSWDEVHVEADRLEHVLSESLEERIALALDDPQYDPHGEPIPSRELRLPSASSLRLSEVLPGQQVVVERVEPFDPEALRYLAGLRLLPTVRLRVLSYSPLDGNLQIQVTGQEPVTLGKRITDRIFVISSQREPPVKTRGSKKPINL
jgi:DtxR family transcriptional regulator, Mn-dependent transcriptional regulator